jgi:MFS family permease
MKFGSWLRSSPLVATTYTANLLVSFHFFFVVYINSSFMSQYVSERSVGVLYVTGSLISVLLFTQFIRILRRTGNVRLTALFIAVEALSLGALAFVRQTELLLFFFTLHLVISPIIYLNLDLFLEKTIKQENITGSARGLFLTMINIAQVLSPILMGILLIHGEYWKVYSASVGFLLLAFALVVTRLRTFTDPQYDYYSFRQVKQRLVSNPAFYNAFVAQFLLRFFYAWMVIYTPLYLFKYVGFPWTDIGAIFTIMLIPFLILEFPLGRAADLFFSEKRMLIIGFIILGGTVGFMPFITEPSFILWAALLFCTRIGASFVEVGSESFFFKHVDSKHATSISIFRVARPAAYVLAATVASVVLIVVPLQWSFLVLSLVMFGGLRYAVALTDTKVAT